MEHDQCDQLLVRKGKFHLFIPMFTIIYTNQCAYSFRMVVNSIQMCNQLKTDTHTDFVGKRLPVWG